MTKNLQVIYTSIQKLLMISLDLALTRKTNLLKQLDISIETPRNTWDANAFCLSQKRKQKIPNFSHTEFHAHTQIISRSLHKTQPNELRATHICNVM